METCNTSRETSRSELATPVAENEISLVAYHLGWQCGSAYASFYPMSTEEEQQHAAQNDAETLKIASEDRTRFLAAWISGVKATFTRRNAEFEHVGVCPCCGQENAPLTDVMLIVGQTKRSGQTQLTPQRLCSSCVELDPEHRFTRSLARSEKTTAVSHMVLSFLVRKDYPTHLIAEQVASTFPSLTDTLVMHAVEGQVALLVAQITPAQFNWVNRLVAQGFILAVGVSLLGPAAQEQCTCGHLLRSSVEQQRGWCLECGIEVSYSQKGYTQ